jgi:YHS domain-containing protein
VIRLIVWLVLASLVLRGLLRLLRGIAEGLQGPPAPKLKATALVRDPVCGMFVVPSSALSAGTGAQTKYFCSEDCRRAYANRERNGASGVARASEVSRSEAPEGTAAKRRRRAPTMNIAQ